MEVFQRKMMRILISDWVKTAKMVTSRLEGMRFPKKVRTQARMTKMITSRLESTRFSKEIGTQVRMTKSVTESSGDCRSSGRMSRMSQD